MRRILLYVFLIILCAFLIPILFTMQFATADTNVANVATKDTEPPILPSPLEEATPEIEGYNFDSIEKETIKIGTGKNVINIYYTKRTNLSYVVNYLEKDET